MILPLKILHHYRDEMTYLNSRLTFRLILARAEAAVVERSGLGCGGENKEEKVQGIQMSLDLLLTLLYYFFKEFVNLLTSISFFWRSNCEACLPDRQAYHEYLRQ